MSIPLQYCPGCGTKHCMVSTNNPDFTLDTLLCDNCKQPLILEKMTDKT